MFRRGQLGVTCTTSSLASSQPLDCLAVVDCVSVRLAFAILQELYLPDKSSVCSTGK